MQESPPLVIEADYWPLHDDSGKAPQLVSVLVVDDEPLVADTIVKLARRLGTTALAVDPAADLIAFCDGLNPHLIILDLALGSTDAVDVLRRLGARRYRGHVLLVSGRDPRMLDQVTAIGKRCGLAMLPPISKPLHAKDLATAFGQLNIGDAEHAQQKPNPLRFDVDEALRKNWLELWYQPQISLATMAPIGAEGLLRLRHPVYGILTPDRFLPSSDDDAYGPMTAFVIDTVARDWRRLKASGFQLGMSVNASIKMIERPAFIQMVKDAWPDSGSRPALTVEVTEDEIVADLSLVLEAAIQLKLYGVNIAIDDFGAGYSSFERIRDLPFSELKLDKSFVMGCADSPKQRAFCGAAVALARQFGLSATAEGVETEAELAVIRQAGFDTLQSYLFARPMPLRQMMSTVLDTSGRRPAKASVDRQV